MAAGPDNPSYLQQLHAAAQLQNATMSYPLPPRPTATVHELPYIKLEPASPQNISTIMAVSPQETAAAEPAPSQHISTSMAASRQGTAAAEPAPSHEVDTAEDVDIKLETKLMRSGFVSS